MKLLLACLALSFAVAETALAWSHDGHELVGFIARERLSQTAEGRDIIQKIEQQLPAGENLGTAATWADRVKSKPDFSPEAAAFAQRNQSHGNWHFVNLPFDAADYSSAPIGRKPTDLVQLLTGCIRLLQSPDPTWNAGNAHNAGPNLNRQEALLLVIHYLGDIHQPLHVGCGYVISDQVGFKFAPAAQASTGSTDRGGNLLVWDPPQYFSNLHHFWDDTIVLALKKNQPDQDYAKVLAAMSPAASWQVGGEPVSWPEKWANDSLKLAPKAFEGLRITQSVSIPPSNPHGKAQAGWEITKPETYLNDHMPMVEQQLAKAGYRLSELLRALFGPH